jgi:hypothetical protein
VEKHHTINGVNVHTQKALPKDFEKGQRPPPHSGGGGGGGAGTNDLFYLIKPFKKYKLIEYLIGHRSYSSNQYNKSDYYTQNTPSSGSHSRSHGHSQNQSAPNFNNFAQMAASFFAAAANKSNFFIINQTYFFNNIHFNYNSESKFNWCQFKSIWWSFNV